MKYLFLIFNCAFFLAIESCRDNKLQNDSNLLPQTINMDKVKNLLPRQLFSDSVVYYKSDLGDVIDVKLKYTSKFSEAIDADGNIYKREIFHILLTNPQEFLSIDIQGFTNYDGVDEKKINSGLIITNSENQSLDLSKNTLLIDYLQEANQLIPNKFSCTVSANETILGRVFENVFSPISSEGSMLRFNLKEGVISLSNRYGKRFIFNKFQ